MSVNKIVLQVSQKKCKVSISFNVAARSFSSNIGPNVRDPLCQCIVGSQNNNFWNSDGRVHIIIILILDLMCAEYCFVRGYYCYYYM